MTCVVCKREHNGAGLQCEDCRTKPRGEIPAAPKAAARLGKDDDSMWEREYRERLGALVKAGEYRAFRWKDFRVRIAATEPGQRDRFYTPEALVWATDGAVEVHEVKGYRREAGMLRFDTARERFPMFRLRMFAKQDGEWVQIRGIEPLDEREAA